MINTGDSLFPVLLQVVTGPGAGVARGLKMKTGFNSAEIFNKCLQLCTCGFYCGSPSLKQRQSMTWCSWRSACNYQLRRCCLSLLHHHTYITCSCCCEMTFKAVWACTLFECTYRVCSTALLFYRESAGMPPSAFATTRLSQRLAACHQLLTCVTHWVSGQPDNVSPAPVGTKTLWALLQHGHSKLWELILRPVAHGMT